MNKLQLIKDDLKSLASEEKAAFLPRFFKTGPGEYGEGDLFIGVTVPDQRKVAKSYFRDLSLADIQALLQETFHEYRQTALFMLVLRFQKAKSEADRQAVVDIYLSSTAFINNWDLVDSSADKILGPHFLEREKDLLYEFAHSGDLWKQRIAVMTTFHFIRAGRYEDTFRLAGMLLHHPHDLIHKAVGWMLREIGNRDFNAEEAFLQKHYRQMPRSMLRYAIEKFPEALRQQYLKGTV